MAELSPMPEPEPHSMPEPGVMPELVHFSSVDTKNILLKKFLGELASSTSSLFRQLSKMLISDFESPKKKKKMRLSINHTTLDGVDAYMVMISGNFDNHLIHLAKTFHGFPRGFPVLWIPDKLIKSFGFYPKFENDADCVNSDQESDFKGATRLEFFKKWSGFLGQLCIWEFEGKFYWTACSKTSERE